MYRQLLTGAKTNHFPLDFESCPCATFRGKQVCLGVCFALRRFSRIALTSRPKQRRPGNESSSRSFLCDASLLPEGVPSTETRRARRAPFVAQHVPKERARARVSRSLYAVTDRGTQGRTCASNASRGGCASLERHDVSPRMDRHRRWR